MSKRTPAVFWFNQRLRAGISKDTEALINIALASQKKHYETEREGMVLVPKERLEVMANIDPESQFGSLMRCKQIARELLDLSESVSLYTAIIVAPKEKPE